MATRKSVSRLLASSPRLNYQQVRRLSLHSYQSQTLLREYGVPVAKETLASTPEEARRISQEFGGECVIKPHVPRSASEKMQFDNPLEQSQYVASPRDGQELAAKIFERLHTQEGEGGNVGMKPRHLLVAEHIRADQEWYLAMTIDREQYCPTIIISRKRNGGMNVETMFNEHPEQLFTIPFSLTKGISADVLSGIQHSIKASPKETEELKNILGGMYRIFVEKDATLLEINSLARTDDGRLLPLDARFTFDDAAAKRQKDLFALRDSEKEVPEEVEAERYGLVYVRMEGNIGNVVNGAGLAMATNDAIGLYGGTSANFLDAGGQATKETMLEAFRIIMGDERVKAILVNIYGGITRCDMIAESIIGAASELGPLRVPVVVRLQGTNSAEGLRLLEEANLGLHVEAGFGEAAKRAVELAASA